MGELIDADMVVNRLRNKNPDMPDQTLQMMRRHFSEHHPTPEDLGQLASRAGVKQLVATHIPFVAKSADEDARYVRRISTKFAGSITISEDLTEY